LSAIASDAVSPKSSQALFKQSGLWLGAAALIAIIMLPQPSGLSIAGQHMLGIFAFAVIVWITEAVEYAASSVMILVLMAFLLGFAPNPARPDQFLGTTVGLSTALQGFTNTAVALIAASLFIAAAMSITGLDKRLAIKVISVIGTSRSRVLIGTIVVMGVLAFFIPTAAARVACLAPIMLGIIAAFGIDKKSRFAGTLMMAIPYLSLIWAIGVATGAAQNVYANGIMDKVLHLRISWIDWLVMGAPYSIVMSVVLYFLLMKMMAPSKEEELAEQNMDIRRSPERLGPISADELRLLFLSVALLCVWATESKLHSVDSSSAALAAVGLMFFPKIGMISWKQVQPKIPWAILIQLGVGVGLGTALLTTGAADWLAKYVVSEFGVQQLSTFSILAILWLFLIILHLGFSSGSAMATTMIPVMIGVLQQAQIPTIKVAGMTMLLTIVTSVGWILPVNGPQNMLALGTETFEVRDFVRVGIVLTIIAYLLLLLFAATYWRWLGYV
jgi:anion transporter